VPLDWDDGELAGDCIWGQDWGSLRPQCHSAPGVIRNPGGPAMAVEAKGWDAGSKSLPCRGGCGGVGTKWLLCTNHCEHGSLQAASEDAGIKHHNFPWGHHGSG
jgi:hypothetical protein